MRMGAVRANGWHDWLLPAACCVLVSEMVAPVVEGTRIGVTAWADEARWGSEEGLPSGVGPTWTVKSENRKIPSNLPLS